LYKVSIPKITKEELVKLYEKIKPIVEIEGKKYFLREFSYEEISGVSFLWNAHEDKREIVNMDEYIPLSQYDFECIHTYGHPTLFKPSIKEVLAQIPDNIKRCVDTFVFEIIEQPETAADFDKNKIVFDNGFHLSKVRLYVKK